MWTNVLNHSAIMASNKSKECNQLQYQDFNPKMRGAAFANTLDHWAIMASNKSMEHNQLHCINQWKKISYLLMNANREEFVTNLIKDNELELWQTKIKIFKINSCLDNRLVMV